MLKNDKDILPLKAGTKVSIFGRIQTHYIKSGTGSGGLVNVEYVVGIVEGLKKAGLVINEELENVYIEWEKENPFNRGNGWSSIPWSQKEMPLDDNVVADAAKFSDVAVVIIGRSAGEDKDNSNVEGSYLLTKAEEEMLEKTRKHFKFGAVATMISPQKFCEKNGILMVL